MKLLEEMRGLREELERRRISEDQWNQFEFQAKHLNMSRELTEVRAAHKHFLLTLGRLIDKAEFFQNMMEDKDVTEKGKGRPEGVVLGPPKSVEK